MDAYKPSAFRKNMEDPAFVSLMNRITQESDHSLTSTFDGYYVIITTKDGKKYKKLESNTPGNQKNPVTWEQVINKFWKSTKFSAVDLGEEKYNRIIFLCKNIEKIEDMRTLLYTLLP